MNRKYIEVMANIEAGNIEQAIYLAWRIRNGERAPRRHYFCCATKRAFPAIARPLFPTRPSDF